MLSQLASVDELQTEAEWLASMITCWANEEWAAEELFAMHANLGAATGQAYARVRQQEDVAEMGDLVLSLATELMSSHDFGPSFTSAFEVSNKVVELLMLRDGCDVCCTSDSDRTAIARFEAQLAAQQQ